MLNLSCCPFWSSSLESNDITKFQMFGHMSVEFCVYDVCGTQLNVYPFNFLIEKGKVLPLLIPTEICAVKSMII